MHPIIPLAGILAGLSLGVALTILLRRHDRKPRVPPPQAWDRLEHPD